MSCRRVPTRKNLLAIQEKARPDHRFVAAVHGDFGARVEVDFDLVGFGVCCVDGPSQIGGWAGEKIEVVGQGGG
jgi:hypothetical protein